MHLGVYKTILLIYNALNKSGNKPRLKIKKGVQND